ncbi:MAG: LamG domain-containing protein [Sedimentisphaerales bacterium]|nr:LamG domain-containing protein [Sedimentisphaerales bacterium]
MLDDVRFYDRVLTQADIDRILATDTAFNISPANGADPVAINTNLLWDEPATFIPSKYDLYYKEGDPNLATGATVVTDIAHTDPCNVYEPPTPVFVLDPCSIDGGKALQLTADELHVRITDSEDDFNFYPQGYTVNTWVKTEQDADYGCMASKQDRTNYPDAYGWVLNCDNTGLAVNALRQVFGSGAGVGIRSTSNIADNQWHMVTGTYDAETGTGSIYVDGKLENQLVDTVRKAATNDYLVLLGAETVLGESPYEGLLDKMSIYSYAISPLDVAVLYTDTTGEELCLEYPTYDLNEDCRVDLLDFAMLATKWLECNLVPTCY